MNKFIHKKEYSDAMGNELMDSFKKKDEVFEIVERDDGFIDAAPVKDRYFSNYKDWSAIEKRGIGYARGKILDVGCGAGRHALYLQKKGLDVTGIDTSPLAIQVCKTRGLRKARLLSINDVEKFGKSSFDSAIMLGHNFGLFQNRKKFKTLLKKFRKILSPKGVIIAETSDPYKTKNSVHVSYHAWNLKRGRMGGQLKLRLRYKKMISPWFDYLFVSQKELRDLLHGTGWKIQKIFGSKEANYIAILVKNS